MTFLPRSLHRTLLCLAPAATLLLPSFAQQTPTVQTAPRSSAAVARNTLRPDREPQLTPDEKLSLVRRRIKYVFVLFQENRSFDFYFGTYPGAYGLYSQPPVQTAGLIQPLVDLDGTVGTVSAFRIPFSVQDVHGKTVPLYPTDLASVNHAHLPMVRKLDFDATMTARNDRYALTEEGVTLAAGKPNRLPTLERKQFGELVMGHIDCDAAPFLWRYADRFVLFDHFFDTVIGPSGPNAIAMIAGQSGETEWMLHPDLARSSSVLVPAPPVQITAAPGVPAAARKSSGATGSAPASGPGATPAIAAPANALPLVANALPYYDLPLDAAGNPAPPRENPVGTHAPNLTFATLPLSFMGSAARTTAAADFDPAFDLRDVKEDIDKIAGHGVGAVPWGWYQQGYGHEPTDPAGVATHKTYVLHHNGPQYFGYVANNPLASAHMHGLGAFFQDVEAHRLPTTGGVFYVRGGYGNIFGLSPADPNPKLAAVYHGDDDHPGYSDSGLSETLLAKEIDSIARSPYWKDSVILIAYDESDGLYDHAQPSVRSFDPSGMALDQGPRIPFILISPYGAAHAISHERTEHSSVIRFVDRLFNLIPLADLPDEEKARALGRQRLQQKDLGPADDKVDGVGDLLSGFSNARLLGKAKPLPPDYAIIPEAEIASTRRADGIGCRALQITPTDTGKPNPLPDDFNPRPDTTPGLPRSGAWTP